MLKIASVLESLNISEDDLATEGLFDEFSVTRSYKKKDEFIKIKALIKSGKKALKRNKDEALENFKEAKALALKFKKGIITDFKIHYKKNIREVGKYKRSTGYIFTKTEVDTYGPATRMIDKIDNLITTCDVLIQKAQR